MLHIKFGCGFCEVSGPCLVRHAGNDEVLEKLATEYVIVSLLDIV